MSVGDPPGVVIAHGLMLALLPPTPTASRRPQARLKWAGPGPLDIDRSDLVFDDDPASPLSAAFDLAAGGHIAAPASVGLIELRRGGTLSAWRFNDHTVTAAPCDRSAWLIATWLPLLLPVPDDPHFMVDVINQAGEPILLPDLVNASMLWIDGKDHRFAVPGHWDGRAELMPGEAARLRFRLDDFAADVPAAPATMRFASGDLSTASAPIQWRRAERTGASPC